LLTPWGQLKGLFQAGQLIECMAPITFDSMIPRQPDASKSITIGQAAQKINGDRPTIHTLQKAGRAAENRRALITPQDNEDHEALVAQWEAELAVGTAKEREESLGNRSEDELFIPNGSPLAALARKTPKGREKGKGKGKGKELAKNSRKRKVRFEDHEEENREHETEGENSGRVLRSGRFSKKTKKARGTKTVL
jgi:hypothetical protein